MSASGNSAITVADSSFSFCQASVGGGAVSLGLGANVWFHGVRFLNNSAPKGGAVLTQMPGDVQMDFCEFSGNTADDGAAVYTTDDSYPAFLSCDFYAGSALRGGSVACDGQSRPTVSLSQLSSSLFSCDEHSSSHWTAVLCLIVAEEFGSSRVLTQVVRAGLETCNWKLEI